MKDKVESKKNSPIKSTNLVLKAEVYHLPLRFPSLFIMFKVLYNSKYVLSRTEFAFACALLRKGKYFSGVTSALKLFLLYLEQKN